MQSHATTDAEVYDDAVTATVPEGAPALPPRISWGAVLAGGVVAVAIGALLNLLGLAVGTTVVDATHAQTPSAGSFSIAAGIWLMVANLIGLLGGGYVAARLSGSTDETDSILHGLSVWAIGFLISALVLGNVVAGTASTAFQGASSMLGGVAQGAGQAVQAAAPAARDAAQGVNPQAVIDRVQASLQTGGDPAAMSSDQRKAEMATLVGRRVRDGGLAQSDSDRLTALMAAEYQIPQTEAQQRLQQVEQQLQQAAQETERRARQAADAAATGAAVAAYWAFAAMLLGAIAAVLGARLGVRGLVAYRRRYA